MRRRRKTEGFNLAFLDIMSCGLGAVILIFLIVKHNVDKGSVEADVTLSELAAMEQRERQLQKEVETARRDNAEERRRGAELAKKLHAIRAATAALERQAAAQQRSNEHLQDAVDEAAARRAADVVADEDAGEEEYLIGLAVEGERVAILLDRSASMTDEKLVDVIVRKTRDAARKRAGPKWRRAQKTVRWLLNRLPRQSRVSLIAFNDKAEVFGDATWNDARDATAVGSLFADVAKLTPTGATNLQAGLERLRKLRPRATDVYLITDGLPTEAVSKPSRLGKCGSLFGKSNNVSGACRELLFQETLRESAPNGGEEVNVILFPLEGDPAAATHFWKWAAATGGMVMTPAAGWP